MCCNNSYSWWSIWHFPSFRFSGCSIALVLGKEKNARVFWLDLFCRVRLHTHADSTHIEFVHVYIRIFADRIIFQIIWCINLRLYCCCWGQKCFGRHPWIWNLLPVTSWPVFSLGWWGLKAVALWHLFTGVCEMSLQFLIQVLESRCPCSKPHLCYLDLHYHCLEGRWWSCLLLWGSLESRDSEEVWVGSGSSLLMGNKVLLKLSGWS